METTRDKLVELLKQIVIPYWADIIADHLIANGVTLTDYIGVKND